MTEVLFISAVTALSCLLPAKTDILGHLYFFRSIVGAHFLVVIL